jgi:amino acid adenylation domain-containing protein
MAASADSVGIALRIRSREDDHVEPSFAYCKGLFDANIVGQMSGHFLTLLHAIVETPKAPIRALNMMPAEERALILDCYSGRSTEYPRLSIPELFAEQVNLRPDAEALVFGADRLTYTELDLRSNQVAQYLCGQGISHEDRVGIFMDRSADLIVSALGILKAGGAYVPIDPDYPAERLKFIAEDTSVRWVLTQHGVEKQLPTAAPLVYIDTADSPILKCSSDPVTTVSTPESSAVVIYTSGSTGQPKAARIPHRAVVRTVRNTNYIDARPDDCIAQVASPSFDAAIMEMWLALLNGATLVGIKRETLLDPPRLIQVIQKEKLTVLILNTAHVHQLGREAPQCLKGVRKVLFGGEAAEPEPLRKLLQQVGPSVLVNGYGPAECCVITTFHEITSIPDDAKVVPIGRPVVNARVYLLDERQEPVALGVPGEIYIGGDGAALGYLNRPDLTAQRFVADPFSGQAGALLYRTGDLARMRPDGEMEFIGRIDEQVKIRGHRIELAEVRQAICAHPAVKQAFLTVREDRPGDKRLVAYVTLHGQLASATESLRTHVKGKLPSHMLPSSFVILDSIPINTNGKVDKKSLPAPHDRPEISTAYKAPETKLECALTEIWRELLRIDRVGVNDNFFELGGHSLLAATLMLRIGDETGQNVPVSILFEAPTIAELARKLGCGVFSESSAVLVPLHKPDRDVGLTPFFYVDALGNSLFAIHKMASLLRRDRAIYALQYPGFARQRPQTGSIETIEETYLSEIQKIQPNGPYYLGGYCIGGLIAYEIAQQLRAAGQKVELLVLIEAFVPGKLQYLHERTGLTEFLDNHIAEFLLRSGRSRMDYLKLVFTNSVHRAKRALGWREPEVLVHQQRINEANARIAKEYVPKPYAGKIIHLMGSDVPSRAYADRRLAWSSLAAGGFEVFVVPGTHYSWADESNIRVTAERLQVYLDRADAGHLQAATVLPKPNRAPVRTESRRHMSSRSLTPTYSAVSDRQPLGRNRKPIATIVGEVNVQRSLHGNI